MRIVLLALAACSASPAPTSPTIPAPTPAVAAAVTPTSAHATLVDAIVGVWVGEADSPMGTFPMRIEFNREGNDVHGRFGDPERYFDFRFHQQDGRWLLTEEGKFPELGVQTHTLVPDGNTARWVDDTRELLVVTFELREPKLVLTALLHGQPHARFELARRGAVSSR